MIEMEGIMASFDLQNFKQKTAYDVRWSYTSSVREF